MEGSALEWDSLTLGDVSNVNLINKMTSEDSLKYERRETEISKINYQRSKDDQLQSTIAVTDNPQSVDPSDTVRNHDNREVISILSSVDVYWRDIKEPFPNPETLPYSAVEVVIGNDLNIFHVGLIQDISIAREGTVDEHAWTVVKFDDKQMEVPLLRIRHSDVAYPSLTLPTTSMSSVNPSISSSPGPNSDRRLRAKLSETSTYSPSTTSPCTGESSSPSRPGVKSVKSSPEKESAVSFPMWIPPWSGNERKAVHIEHHSGDRIEVFRPANSEGPANWTRAIVRYVFKEDPRKASALGLFDMLPEYQNGERSLSDCATDWGGVCDCILGKGCLGMRSHVPLRSLAYEIEWSTLPSNCASPYSIVPWYACRVPNQHRAIHPSDVTTCNYEIPEFLWRASASRGISGSYSPDTAASLGDTDSLHEGDGGIWVESDGARLVMNQLRYHSQVLLLTMRPSVDRKSWVVNLVGNTFQIGTATQYLEHQVQHLKSNLEFLERREKRLKLLEERKSRYERNQQLEFEADDGLVGLIIGKQGEHLSRIARNHKVEIRVLPDDDGYRRVRIYGDNPRAAIKAKNELSYNLMYLKIDKKKTDVLQEKRGLLLKEIAQRTNLNSIWIDQGLQYSDDKIGLKESTAVMAVEAARKHPIKSKDVIRGTPSEPVVILCGLSQALATAKHVILQNNTYESMLGSLGTSTVKRSSQVSDRPRRGCGSRRN